MDNKGYFDAITFMVLFPVYAYFFNWLRKILIYSYHILTEKREKFLCRIGDEND